MSSLSLSEVVHGSHEWSFKVEHRAAKFRNSELGQRLRVGMSPHLDLCPERAPSEASAIYRP